LRRGPNLLVQGNGLLVHRRRLRQIAKRLIHNTEAAVSSCHAFPAPEHFIELQMHKKARLGLRQIAARSIRTAAALVRYAVRGLVACIGFHRGRRIVDASLLLLVHVGMLGLRGRPASDHAAALVFLPATAGAGIVATELWFSGHLSGKLQSGM